jgi:hypothetical protein
MKLPNTTLAEKVAAEIDYQTALLEWLDFQLGYTEEADEIQGLKDQIDKAHYHLERLANFDADDNPPAEQGH